MTDLLARLSDLDPRFAVLPALPAAAGADWLAADRLVDPVSPETVAALDAEEHASGHTTRHAAALSMLAAYACTVPTAAIAGWALTGAVLDMRAANVAVQLGDHHGFEAYAVREVRVGDGGVAQLVDEVLLEHLLPLAESLHSCTRAGLRQLHGGVGFGIATAFSLLSRLDQDLDLLQRRYEELVASVAERTDVDLHDLGELRRVTASPDGTGRARLFYLRRTCCLVYTSAQPGLCASCCLLSEADRVEVYRSMA